MRFFTINDCFINSVNSQEISRVFSKNGMLIITEKMSRGQFQYFCSKFGEIYKHPHASEDGITSLKKLYSNSGSVPPGHFGMSTEELSLHTDRSNMDKPPNVIFMYCNKDALTGGRTRLLDGKTLYHVLQVEYPEILAETKQSTAICTIDSKKNMPIFCDEGGVISIRFRNDELVTFGPRLTLHLERLKHIMRGLEISVHLQEGSCLMVNNSRWLHGRSKFCGKREIWRALVYAEQFCSGFQEI